MNDDPAAMSVEAIDSARNELELLARRVWRRHGPVWEHYRGSAELFRIFRSVNAPLLAGLRPGHRDVTAVEEDERELTIRYEEEEMPAEVAEELRGAARRTLGRPSRLFIYIGSDQYVEVHLDTLSWENLATGESGGLAELRRRAGCAAADQLYAIERLLAEADNGFDGDIMAAAVASEHPIWNESDRV